MASFQIIASVFILWLTVFSTCGYASSYDEVHTQSKTHTQSDALTAAAAAAKPPASKPFPGYPFPNIPGWPISGGGGGGGPNGGGGWLRIWTPIGWITIGGGGGGHGGGGGGSIQPGREPPLPFKPPPGWAPPPLFSWIPPIFGGKPPKSKLINGQGGGGDATKPEPLTAGTESVAVGTGEVEKSEKTENYKCWSPLHKTNNCVNQIFSSYSSKKYKMISSECCSSIQNMSKDCHARTIGSFHDHFFVNSVSEHCSAAA